MPKVIAAPRHPFGSRLSFTASRPPFPPRFPSSLDLVHPAPQVSREEPPSLTGGRTTRGEEQCGAGAALEGGEAVTPYVLGLHNFTSIALA